MKYFNKIKLWDDEHCEKHVWNLVNNMKKLLQSKNINELYILILVRMWVKYMI